ncbi:hypothetical protein [Enterovirga sp.]|uniref:hypothetical protein n=1 Tax=Enterovirga sp. TaxID=2026350 RepID=UPI002C343126|nr:hypothetical protein [Enterovirga sp.]HMO28206.1 hypothetical protein [Enterovirga sp.]
MRALVASAAVVVLVFSASHAEARAGFKLRSFTSRTPSSPAAARPAQSGIAPVVFIGGSSGARREGIRDDMPTSSTVPAPAPAIMPPAAKPRIAAKPAFVCPQDRTVGAGRGFCELN